MSFTNEQFRALENTELLFGAHIEYFSPLADERLPADIDGLIIGGGFPEMFAAQLERNESMRRAVKCAALDGLPILAECGGYMYLQRRLIDFDGRAHEMCGVFDGTATMTKRLQSVGYVTACAGEMSFHAHEFRYSVTDMTETLFDCRRARDGVEFTAGARYRNVIGSYLHVHFAGCRQSASRFVEMCLTRR